MTLADFLGDGITAGLRSKSSETRCTIADDIESVTVKAFTARTIDAVAWTSQCLNSLEDELIRSAFPNQRKAGLVAIAGLVLGSRGHSSPDVLANAILICVECVSDEDGKVRYAASEALFNIIRSCRRLCVPSFKLLFCAICKLQGDSDSENRQIAPSLDRLLREVVSETAEGDQAIEILNVLISSFHLPNIHPKQLTLSWIPLMRALFPVPFFDKLSSFLPPLFSVISQSASSVQGWRDVAIVAVNTLRTVLEDIKDGRASSALSNEAANSCINVLIKYGRFQDSLTSDLSRVILFDWIGILGSSSSFSLVPDASVELVIIVVRTLGCDPPKLVSDAIRRAHHRLLSSSSFMKSIETLAGDLMEKIEAEIAVAQCLRTVSRVVLDWIQIASKITKVRSVDTLLSLELTSEILHLCLSSFSIEEVATRILSLARCMSSPDALGKLAELVSESVTKAGQMEAFLSVVATVALSDDGEFIFKLVQSVLDQEEIWTDQLVDQYLDGPVASVCRGASLLIAIRSLRWNDFEALVDSLDQKDMRFVESICLSIESEAFSERRLVLLQDAAFAKGMTKIAMRMGQSSPAFMPLFNRLQLVTVFKLFH